MRVFARRERPHPGAQLTLFETEDGWRYSLWVTNLPAAHARLARPARLHRRRPPGPRPGRGLPSAPAKTPASASSPATSLAINKAWLAAALTAATLLAWLRLLALDGHLARAEPKTLRYRILHAAARLARSGRRRRLKIAATWPWARPSPPPGTGSAPCRRPPDQHQNHPCDQGRNTRGPWNPRPPGPPAGPRHTPTLKSRSTTRPGGRPRPATGQRE